MKNLLWILPVLLASSASATNLLTNGDFESGNTGFSTGYSLTSGCTGPGTYEIVTNPNTTCGTFASYGDHTSGSGNMMLVDGNTNAVPYYGTNGTVWSETVTGLSTSTLYTFTGWVTSADAPNPAVLALFANGTQVGSNFDAPSSAGLPWVEWTQGFTPGTPSITLSIQDVNPNPLTAGDDFALDDLDLEAPSTGTPEPASLLLAGAGFAALIARRLTSRRSRS